MVQDEPVVRKQLPTWQEEADELEQKVWTGNIAFLLARGYIGAAEMLSQDYWGYGFEDTDNDSLRAQRDEDHARAEEYLKGETK